MTREEIVTELLERYPDLIAASVGGPGDGSGVIGMPPTYTKSVRLLERALLELREEDRNLWWHVSERYIRAQRIQREVWRLRSRWTGVRANESVISLPGGWHLALSDERHRNAHKAHPVVVTVARWHPDVKPGRVREGVSWIACRFDAWGEEPNLPEQLFAVA